MGRSNNNNSLISGESGGGGGGGPVTSTSPSVYLPNYHLPHQYSHVSHHHQLPPSPPIHPQQYINMGHLASAAVFYDATNNSCSVNPNVQTPPARVYSPLSHGSSAGSSISYASSPGGAGGGGGGSGGASNGTLTIMEAVQAVTNVGSGSSVKFEYEDFPQEPDGGPVKTTTWKDHVAVFNMDQVGVMCDVLLQEGDMPRLVDLLATIAKDFVGRSEKILRAQAHVAFHAALEDPRKFPQVYNILERHAFSPQYHSGLQKLWFSAHYKEAEITRGRPLGAVDKYRIRRKFPLPRTIWDGEETVYCFKERSRNALRQSFIHEKYPNLEEKKKLSKETGLTMTQVGNWFKNKRQREKEKMQGKAGAKRPKSYSTPAALAAAMTPDLLGMMLNPGGMNQSHIHHPHHHHHHPHAHQSHMAPLSPEDLEHAIRKARYEEARLKNYMDENMYSQQTSSAPPPTLSPSYLNPHHPHHHQHQNQQQHQSANNNGQNVSPRSSSSSQHPQHHMVLPGKSEITIGIVGSPGNPNHHNHHSGGGGGGGGNQEASPRSANGGGSGGGLTITAIPSPNNPNGTSTPSQNANSSPLQAEHANNLDNGSPTGNSSGDLYNRPRSTSSNLSSGGRCGADLIVPYIHSASHHHPHHSPYHHHHHHPHHHHHSSMASGYDTGVAPLIHPGAPPALSHA